MPHAIRPGDVLAGRYQLIDLLDESAGGLFYRAHDSSLDRSVAVHIIRADDERAALLREAARTSARVVDRRLLRVLDVDETSDQTTRDGSALCFVVNEWATGVSLDILLADDGPLAPRRAAWLIGEVAATLEVAHAAGVAHGRLVPENVLIDRTGSVRVIGFAVDAALHGLPSGRVPADVTGLAALLYAALTSRWPGASPSVVKPAPHAHGRVLRPRQVRAGVPRVLDTLCDAVLNPDSSGPGSHARGNFDLATAGGIGEALHEFVGDTTGLADTEAAAIRRREAGQPLARPSWTTTLPVVPIITAAAPSRAGASPSRLPVSPTPTPNRTSNLPARARPTTRLRSHRSLGTSSPPRRGSRSSTTTATWPGWPSVRRSRRPRRRSTRSRSARSSRRSPSTAVRSDSRGPRRRTPGRVRVATGRGTAAPARARPSPPRAAASSSPSTRTTTTSTNGPAAAGCGWRPWSRP